MKEHPTLTNSREYFKQTRSDKNEILQHLGAPHTDSFNYMLSDGLNDCVKNINPICFEMPDTSIVKLWIESASISRPKVPFSAITSRNKKIYPSECRQRAITYKGTLSISVGWSVNGVNMQPIEKDLGGIPIMVKTNACNLNGMTPEELVAQGEHEREWGGYFIVKGHEKLIRMLLLTRKNYPITIQRSSWKNRGKMFSDMGIFIRCVKTDQTSINNVLHFVNNGSSKIMLSFRKSMFYLPAALIMKALVNHTDEYIYQRLIQGYENDQYYVSCVQQMLREVHDENIHSHIEAKTFLGNVFQNTFKDFIPFASQFDIATFFLNECLFIHLPDHQDKFNLMVMMTQKLYQFVQNKIKVEGADCVMMQEILLGGHLYQIVVKDRLETWLQFLKTNILKLCIEDEALNQTSMSNAIRCTGQIDRIMENFLATGNVSNKSSISLPQTSGLVIIAENINRMRYMSHFRSVHRGSFFVEMRTTEARQLLPDAWGFICPVHTPDGTPCGLLNHLTINCVISKTPAKELVDNIPKVLSKLGMVPWNSKISNLIEYSVVMLEGQIIGYIEDSMMKAVDHRLRLLKITGTEVPNMLEIVLVPKRTFGQYPGLYLFVGPARMMRPVTNLYANAIEYIGTFEQIYLDICISADEAYPNLTTHMELSKTSFMSNLANLIPMPDCNQSPRNMYQCQMGKQTMGTPCHNWQLQADNKLYRLQTPTTPLFRPVHHDNIDLDDFAMGVNAIVAVISYTGYDMEDAMIINKSAFERGLAHGSIYKSEFIELKGNSYFARDPTNKQLEKFIDNDGLPFVGRQMEFNSVYYCYYDTNEAKYHVQLFKNKEVCYVDTIRLCGDFSLNSPKVVCVTIRIPRNPTVGDKFASRAGQKGICSQKWPTEDLPFTESGLIPDIVFNPHGFPSRMTIAMMIEIMAGKTGSIHGMVHDATPFRFTESNTAIDHFGRLLQEGGYNYYGTERLYSGIDGREMVADIFFGIVHYQRLRHMVSDKWQVRSTGPIEMMTHQPIKGRKRGGGVRFGEMERDALIAHGATFLLQDRLLHCSDKASVHFCKNCGTLLGPTTEIGIQPKKQKFVSLKARCRLCSNSENIDRLEIPYIFKYLIAQLSAVNINVKMEKTDI